MNVSSISNLFQNNSFLQANNPFVKGNQGSKQAELPSDLIQQVSDQMIAKNQGSVKVDPAEKAQKIKMDTYVKTESSWSLEEMPSEVLVMFMEQTRIMALTSSRQEQDLISFKERLQGMDQAIQGYQDILDAKAELPKGLKTEDVVHSITKAKQIREQFVRDSVVHLNEQSTYFNGDPRSEEYTDRLMKKLLGENKFAGWSSSDWMINASAADLYTEIDRVLTETQSVTAEWERGIKRIYNVLKDRGFGDKYHYILDCWKAEKGCYFRGIEAEEEAQQQLMDKLMQMPLQEVKSSG